MVAWKQLGILLKTNTRGSCIHLCHRLARLSVRAYFISIFSCAASILVRSSPLAWMFQTREMRKKRGEKNIGEKWTKRKWSLNPPLAAGYHPSSRSSPDKRPDEFHCPPIWVEIEFTWHVKTTLFFVFMRSWHWMIKREITLISQRKK